MFTIDGPIVPEEFGDIVVELDVPQLGRMKVPWQSFLVGAKLNGATVILKSVILSWAQS